MGNINLLENSQGLFRFLILLKKYDIQVDICLPVKERYEKALKELYQKMGTNNGA